MPRNRKIFLLLLIIASCLPYFSRAIIADDPFDNSMRPHFNEGPQFVPTQTDQFQSVIFPIVEVVFLTIILIASIKYLYDFHMEQEMRKKRYLETIDLTKLPKNGPRSAFVGVLAETDVHTYVDLDKLQMHTLVAGASGSGKTVAAQVIIEEALMKGVSVMLFDPTAQWTGFLRAQKNPKMLSMYSTFGMAKKSARSFPGNIIYVEDPNMPLDVKKYMKAGEVTVFVLTKLQPKPRQSDDGKVEPSQIELFVANTIQRIFESNLDESPQLRLLVVYDEVHRLLPKFGGSGLGFTQIERGAREFRKWGVGMVLISQVLSDFVGEIKANIGTEIQMRTKYEGDLERVEFKFGPQALSSVVKSSIGTGMMHSPEFNNGQPYFVTFRPLLHDVVRLSDAELATYKSYNDKIDKIARRIVKLKASGQDVFDLELELDLARDKLKKGNFNIVDVYVESVSQRVDQLYSKLGIMDEK